MNEYTSDIPDERTALLANQDPAIDWLIDQCSGRYWLFANATTIELLSDQITFFIPHKSIMSVHADINKEGKYFTFRVELRDSKGFASMNLRYLSPERAAAAKESILDYCRNLSKYHDAYWDEAYKLRSTKPSANDDHVEAPPAVLTRWQKVQSLFQTTLSFLRK